MLNLPSHRLPAPVRWFPTGAAGSAALTEHVLTTEAGRGWVDRVIQPCVLAAECADHVLLRGDPQALTPRDLPVFADHCVEAPGRFLPLFGAACERVVPWQRVVYVKRSSVPAARPPRGVTVRRLNARDARALTTLPPSINALCSDLAARGHVPRWTCSTGNRPADCSPGPRASAPSGSTPTTPSAHPWRPEDQLRDEPVAAARRAATAAGRILRPRAPRPVPSTAAPAPSPPRRTRHRRSVAAPAGRRSPTRVE